MRFVFFTVLLLIVIISYATFLDNPYKIYYSEWFEGLFFIFFFSLLFAIFKFKLYKTKSFLIHFSILVILLGSFVSRHFSIKGEMIIKNHQTLNYFYEVRNDKVFNKKIFLPFYIKLKKFKIKKYVGSDIPSSYESFIEVIDKNKRFSYKIFMNHILVYKGYRIYQSDYLKDESGSILFINYDIGVYIVYFGYLLFLLGVFRLFFDKKVLIIVLSLFHISYGFNFDSFNNKSKIVEKDFSSILVQYNGRIVPFDTLNKALINKLTLKNGLYGLDYNQLIMFLLTHKEISKIIPLIYVKNEKIREILGIKNRYAPYFIFFDEDGHFKFKSEIEAALKTADIKRDRIQRDWLDLNDRLATLYMIYNLDLFRMFPTPSSKKLNNEWFSVSQIQNTRFSSKIEKLFYTNLWDSLIDGLEKGDIKEFKNRLNSLQVLYSKDILPSSKKVELEIFYNHLDGFNYLPFIYLFLFLLLLFFENRLLYLLSFLVLIFHFLLLMIRFYLSGFLPLSNAYESLITISFFSVFITLFFKDRIIKSSGMLVASIFLFVANLNSINPQITTLKPVLQSYWLLIHVSIVLLSYAFFLVAFMLGVFSIILKKDFNLYIFNLIGFLLLSLGTFLGAVWASESWGDYWSFDVKEAWSLVLMMVYGINVHLYKLKYTKRLDILSILAIFYLLMTYFGVNFYLSKGLHSYGQENIDSNSWIYIIISGMILWIGYVLKVLFKGK